MVSKACQSTASLPTPQEATVLYCAVGSPGSRQPTVVPLICFILWCASGQCMQGSVGLWTSMCVLAEARAGCWVSSSITLCLTALGQRSSQNWKHTLVTFPASQQVFRVSLAFVFSPHLRGCRHRLLCIASSQALRSYFGNLIVLRPYPLLASQPQCCAQTLPESISFNVM